MVLGGQRVQPERYTVIPRTLSFLFSGDKILLIRLGGNRGAWSGKYNGVGGHIEAGEDPLNSAIREIREETGLKPLNLALTGIVQVDTGSVPGISLFVFTGDAPELPPASGDEGIAQWVEISELDSLPLVEDLVELIPAAIASRASGLPFSATTSFDVDGKPIINFAHA
jgi:8-oxo-dGTP diphosphatase